MNAMPISILPNSPSSAEMMRSVAAQQYNIRSARFHVFISFFVCSSMSARPSAAVAVVDEASFLQTSKLLSSKSIDLFCTLPSSHPGAPSVAPACIFNSSVLLDFLAASFAAVIVSSVNHDGDSDIMEMNASQLEKYRSNPFNVK